MSSHHVLHVADVSRPVAGVTSTRSSRRAVAAACAASIDGEDAATATDRVAGEHVTTDALLRRVRWLGVLFCALQFALYTPPPGMQLPFPRAIGVVVAIPLVLVNLVGILARGGLRARWPRGWIISQLIVDGGVIGVILWLFAFDAGNALWALPVLPVLQGALRLRRRGALLTWVCMSGVYVARDVWAAHAYDHVTFYVDSVTFRLGVVGIVAWATGSLAGRLAGQVEAYKQSLAEADGLRLVACSAQHIASLDPETVLDEVSGAARRIGFTAVDVLVAGAPAGERAEGAVARSPSFAALLEACADKPVLVDADAVARRRDGATTAIAAPVRCGDDVEAIVLAGQDGPIPARHVEALELLAAQAGAALLNARRYREHEAFERALAHQATHDELTGLPNRALLQDRAQRAIAAGRRDGTHVAVLLLDLDRFKEINDTLGHAYGDGLLRQVADRLASTLRSVDTAARLGGDEFAVLATDLHGLQDARRVAERVLDALSPSYTVDGVTLDVEASLGVAVFPRHGSRMDELLRAADVAMYAAKAASAGIVEYDAARDEHTPARLALLGDLRRALDDPEQLTLHFQPKVDLACQRLVGVEALLRWQHPTRGSISPAEFIPVAEGTGLIHRLTAHVLDMALQQARSWRERGLHVPVAVNVSTRCLLDQNLPDRVCALLKRHCVPASLLRIEITESTIMADPARALSVLSHLHAAGVRLSLDDFGTGYSSMSYLKRLPVDELKIDRSFVTEMNVHEQDATLVRTVVELGHNLGLQVVAEGVETSDTLRKLDKLGCDVAQGYYLSRPLPANELMGWLNRHIARSPKADEGVGAARR